MSIGVELQGTKAVRAVRRPTSATQEEHAAHAANVAANDALRDSLMTPTDDSNKLSTTVEIGAVDFEFADEDDQEEEEEVVPVDEDDYVARAMKRIEQMSEAGTRGAGLDISSNIQGDAAGTLATFETDPTTGADPIATNAAFSSAPLAYSVYPPIMEASESGDESLRNSPASTDGEYGNGLGAPSPTPAHTEVKHTPDLNRGSLSPTNVVGSDDPFAFPDFLGGSASPSPAPTANVGTDSAGVRFGTASNDVDGADETSPAPGDGINTGVDDGAGGGDNGDVPSSMLLFTGTGMKEPTDEPTNAAFRATTAVKGHDTTGPHTSDMLTSWRHAPITRPTTHVRWLVLCVFASCRCVFASCRCVCVCVMRARAHAWLIGVAAAASAQASDPIVCRSIIMSTLLTTLSFNDVTMRTKGHCTKLARTGTSNSCHETARGNRIRSVRARRPIQAEAVEMDKVRFSP
jgi:hypothetical protein